MCYLPYKIPVCTRCCMFWSLRSFPSPPLRSRHDIPASLQTGDAANCTEPPFGACTLRNRSGDQPPHHMGGLQSGGSEIGDGSTKAGRVPDATRILIYLNASPLSVPLHWKPEFSALPRSCRATVLNTAIWLRFSKGWTTHAHVSRPQPPHPHIYTSTPTLPLCLFIVLGL